MPYPEGCEKTAEADLKAQADKIVGNLQIGSIKTAPDKEIIAVIAYLQRLGKDIKAAPAQTAQAAPVKTDTSTRN